MRDNVGVALVVSCEIAGVKAAIDLADVGFSVYLLDESASIEGIMVELDRILRTSDCPSCVLPPKPVDMTEDTRIEHAASKDSCNGCKAADSFASAMPLNDRTTKPNQV